MNKSIPPVVEFLRFQLRVEADARSSIQQETQHWHKMHSGLTAMKAYNMALLACHGGYGPPSKCKDC